jgi:hypothetical protein
LHASASAREGVHGDIEALSLWAGQSAGLIDEVLAAGDRPPDRRRGDRDPGRRA